MHSNEISGGIFGEILAEIMLGYPTKIFFYESLRNFLINHEKNLKRIVGRNKSDES